MSQLSLSIDGKLAKLVLHDQPQNRLTQPFFAELGETIAEIGRSGARAALLSAEGPDFSFGGDIAPGRSSARTNCASRSSSARDDLCR